MIIQKIRQSQPLVHCITNYVVANFTANGLLAVGASPVMADELEEVKEMVALADALLLNIGTINTRTYESMIVAGKEANRKGIPVVLDPVGVGATSFRQTVAFNILEHVKIALIRCNIGELAALGQSDSWQVKGVDSGSGELDVIATAKSLALKYDCLVVVTGVKDVITDGSRVIKITGGNRQITEVTGTGCLLGALTAAVFTLEGDKVNNLQQLLASYKEIAEVASEKADGLGSFQIELLNQLNQYSMER